MVYNQSEMKILSLVTFITVKNQREKTTKYDFGRMFFIFKFLKPSEI